MGIWNRDDCRELQIRGMWLTEAELRCELRDTFFPVLKLQ
jgi:hypothetical protein